jgi:hypothetical protein
MTGINEEERQELKRQRWLKRQDVSRMCENLSRSNSTHNQPRAPPFNFLRGSECTSPNRATRLYQIFAGHRTIVAFTEHVRSANPSLLRVSKTHMSQSVVSGVTCLHEEVQFQPSFLMHPPPRFPRRGARIIRAGALPLANTIPRTRS